MRAFLRLAKKTTTTTTLTTIPRKGGDVVVVALFFSPNRLSSSRLCAFTSSATTTLTDDDDPKKEVDGFSVFPQELPSNARDPSKDDFINDATSPPRTREQQLEYNKHESLRDWLGRQSRKRSVDEIVVLTGNIHRGSEILHNAVYNKGTGFNHSERERLGVRGLVPPRYFSIKEQAEKVWQQQVAMRESNAAKIGRWRHLQALKDRNETLFYRLLQDHVEELAPVIYTPTVGEACLNYSRFFRRARGMYFTKDDVGHMHSMTYNWRGDVKIVVVTDGSRVLGLGDLGAHGMGISIGKLDLYVAGGGFDPQEVLPVCLDVGTNNKSLLNDKWYVGLNSQRLEGGDYYRVIDEFMRAIRHRWPKALIQFEDFQTKHALEILTNYRNDYLCFNDDIQGTAAVVLAGVYGALKVLGAKDRSEIRNQKFVMCGAGSAGMGIVSMLHKAVMKSGGLSEEEAYDNFFIMDNNGLITNERELEFPREAAVEPFAKARKATKELPDGASLLDVVTKSKCTALLGASTVNGLFTEDVLRQMGEQNERPIIFPLSNPTSNAECTSEDAAKATDGRAIFSSGSPFEDAKSGVSGRVMRANQGNNLYIFPGLGLGAVLSGAKTISEEMLVSSAKAIADMLTEDQIRKGCVFPMIKEIRNISARVAVRVIKQAAEEGQAKRSVVKIIESDDEHDTKLFKYVKRAQYVPEYRPTVFPVEEIRKTVDDY